MISINICRAEAVWREGIHVLLMEYNTLCFPLLNCQEKLSDSSVIRTGEKSATGERVKVTAQDHLRPSSRKNGKMWWRASSALTEEWIGEPLIAAVGTGRGDGPLAPSLIFHLPLWTSQLHSLCLCSDFPFTLKFSLSIGIYSFYTHNKWEPPLAVDTKARRQSHSLSWWLTRKSVK